MILSALNQIPVRAHLAAGRALGYGRGVVWVKVILPQVYPLVRLPVFAVLAFGLSVVDMAVILGPSNPPTLAVAVTRWAFAPDTAMLLPAAAAALMLAGIARGRDRGVDRGGAGLRAGGPVVGAARRARGGRGAGAAGGERGAGGAVRAGGVVAHSAGGVVGRVAVELSRMRCPRRGRARHGRGTGADAAGTAGTTLLIAGAVHGGGAGAGDCLA